MNILLLGGTAWLGREIAAAAKDHGHTVTALARGVSGAVPEGVALVRADRSQPGAYAEVADLEWDAVIDVGRQPGQVRSALAALGGRTPSWVFVSSSSVYASHDEPGADENAALLPAYDRDEDSWETYGGRKVACEQALLDGIPDRVLIARSGLIAGPGDHTDRTGYWPLRFAHPATPEGAVLIPDSPLRTSVLDVRDLAAWLVEAAERRLTGIFNTSGPVMPLDEHLAAARRAAGHSGETVPVSQEWLIEHGVEPWSGERSLPLWLPLPEYAGFTTRDTSAATREGLKARALEDTLEDTLAWEVRQGPGRVRKAGLTPADEADLIAAARAGG